MSTVPMHLVVLRSHFLVCPRSKMILIWQSIINFGLKEENTCLGGSTLPYLFLFRLNNIIFLVHIELQFMLLLIDLLKLQILQQYRIVYTIINQTLLSYHAQIHIFSYFFFRSIFSIETNYETIFLMSEQYENSAIGGDLINEGTKNQIEVSPSLLCKATN